MTTCVRLTKVASTPSPDIPCAHCYPVCLEDALWLLSTARGREENVTAMNPSEERTPWKRAQEEGHLRLWVEYYRQLVEPCSHTTWVGGKEDASPRIDQIAGELRLGESGCVDTCGGLTKKPCWAVTLEFLTDLESNSLDGKGWRIIWYGRH